MQADADGALEIKYQELYVEKLRTQEEARVAVLTKMREKQSVQVLR